LTGSAHYGGVHRGNRGLRDVEWEPALAENRGAGGEDEETGVVLVGEGGGGEEA
jgi:hypothetical protein